MTTLSYCQKRESPIKTEVKKLTYSGKTESFNLKMRFFENELLRPSLFMPLPLFNGCVFSIITIQSISAN